MTDNLSNNKKDNTISDNEYNSRPKEQLQILEANCSFVDVLYNEKLHHKWHIVAKTDSKTHLIQKDNFAKALNEAEQKVLKDE